MELLQELLLNLGAIIAAIAALIVAISNLLTMFIDERKVTKFFKPVVKGLNWLALNIGKNKNETDK
jgi:hypothetical protein